MQAKIISFPSGAIRKRKLTGSSITKGQALEEMKKLALEEPRLFFLLEVSYLMSSPIKKEHDAYSKLRDIGLIDQKGRITLATCEAIECIEHATKYLSTEDDIPLEN